MANTSIVTESARNLAAVLVADYATSVRNHINGGWEAHHQFGVVAEAYPIAAFAQDQVAFGAEAHEVSSATFPGKMLRLQLTRIVAASGETPEHEELFNVVVPVVAITSASGASLGVTTAPRIDTGDSANYNMTSVALATDATTTLKIALDPSDDPARPTAYPVVYQWYRNNVPLTDSDSSTAGVNTRALVITMGSSGTAAAVGSYKCAVANFGGVTHSTVAAITHS